MPSFELYPWLQVTVAIATIISSIGVILALIQILISKGQFEEQLKITKDQFNLSNQGYISFDASPNLLSPVPVAGANTSIAGIYNSFSLAATLENAGNIPVVFQLVNCSFYFNNIQVYNAPITTVGKSTLVPKQKTTFGLGQADFMPNKTPLTIPQIQALNIFCVFKFSYHDFNSTHLKTIDRTLVINVTPPIIGGTYTVINDTF